MVVEMVERRAGRLVVWLVEMMAAELVEQRVVTTVDVKVKT